jgi:hypothetical protein
MDGMPSLPALHLALKPPPPTGTACRRGGGKIEVEFEETGMQYNDLLGGLSQALPRFVDALTPDGRLMSDAEAEQTL